MRTRKPKASPRLRPPFKSAGGKYYLAPKIIKLLPPHRVYLEPFVGGGNILINKPRSYVEIASDLDRDLIGFYEVLRDRPDDLIKRSKRIPCTEESLFWASAPGKKDDAMAKAVKFLVRRRFSRGACGKSFSWSNRLRGGQPGDKNSWETIQHQLPLIAQRLQGVELCHEDAMTMIARWNYPDIAIYCDPPYMASTRTARNVFQHEMSDVDHINLLEALVKTKSSVIISGYPSELYTQMLAKWTRIDIDMPNHAGQGRTKQRRTECLWRNW
jgi:DNA adenine methylase